MNTEAIIGAAGTGKSFLLRQRIEEDSHFALLTASTGIAAVNLGEGVTTIHSALGFYDLQSLCQAASQGRIKAKAIQLAKKGYKNLVLDEVSMFSGAHLQLIHDEFEKAAVYREEQGEESCGLIVTGDACQLQPVPDDRTSKEPVKLFFESPCWPLYEANLTHLTQSYRQDNPAFLEALQLARAGRGVDAAIALKKCGVEFSDTQDDVYDGITLFPVNAQVDAYNSMRLQNLPGSMIAVPSEKWGKQRGEWKNIPDVLLLKDGALVMVLVNQPKTFRYVNGDLATFRVQSSVAIDNKNDISQSYGIETKRGFKGELPFSLRRNLSFADVDSVEEEYSNSTWYLGELPTRQTCDGCEPPVAAYTGQRWVCDECSTSYYWYGDKKMWCFEHSSFSLWMQKYREYMEAHEMYGKPYYDPLCRGTVVGEIRYLPLRLAYGSSYHKVQGLTMDKCQVNINHYWASLPGMLYVALSRCRSVEGLRIVGNVNSLARKIKTDVRVRRWV